jgi:membrane-associated phospholipid phosphatase
MPVRLRQALMALVTVAVGLTVFLLLERVVTPRHCLEMRLDRAVPFWPLTLPLYELLFPFVILAAGLAEPAEFERFEAAMIVACVVALVCFVAFPVTNPRPPSALIANPFLRDRFERMWRLDAATNGCPSLHVALAGLAAATLVQRRRGTLANAVTILVAVGICASTLTVKQHTVCDLAGGAALAAVATTLAARFRPRPRR